MQAAEPKSGFVERLIEHIDAMPRAEQDMRACEGLIVDSVACMLGSARRGADSAVSAWAREQPRSVSTISMRLAAASNVLELDAMHVASSVHPGTVIVPAALAVAWELDASPADLVRAVLRGTQAAVMLGRSTGRAHRERFQSTSTCGAFGAALACAWLYRLGTPESAGAMGLSLSTAGGLWSFVDENCDAKQWHAANAAHCGVLCAQLAGAGLQGPRRVLESSRGFWKQLCGDAQSCELELAGQGWAVREVAYKPWPAPRPAHAVIAAALQAHGRHAMQTVARVEVRTFAFAVQLLDRKQVRSEHDARFSLQFLVTAALLLGSIGLDTFASWDSPRMQEFMARVVVIGDTRMSERYPAHSSGSLRIVLNDGSRVDHTASAAPGDPECPLTDEQWEGKWDLLFGADAPCVLDDLRGSVAGGAEAPGMRDAVERWFGAGLRA